MPEFITLEIDDNVGVGPYFEEVHRQLMMHYLVKTGGHIGNAAALMGRHPQAVRASIQTLGMEAFLEELRVDVEKQKKQKKAAEAEALRADLDAYDGNITTVARRRGLNYDRLYKRLEEYDLIQYARRLRSARDEPKVGVKISYE